VLHDVLDEAFAISGIIKVLVSVISQSQGFSWKH